MSEFSLYTVLHVWEKANIVEGYNPDIWRKDFAGAWIKRDAYNETSAFGWNVVLDKPESKGGNFEMTNLRPMHWQNAESKGDNYPYFKSKLSSLENKNIEKELTWEISI